LNLIDFWTNLKTGYDKFTTENEALNVEVRMAIIGFNKIFESKIVMYTTKKDSQSLYQVGARVMETRDHFKNGASPKSLTSRGNCKTIRK
jgi:hypothetical protein